MQDDIKNDKTFNISVNSTNKTMDYVNNVTKSVINQTDNDQEIETSQEKEARNLVRKAKELTKPRCCFSLICSTKEERHMEIANLYYNAGDLFKSAQNWLSAGRCYENSSILKSKVNHDPLIDYEKAYYCYDKIDIGDDAEKILEKMNLCLEKKGKFFEIGKNYENMAIKKEKKEKYDLAIDYYLKAITYYDKDRKHKNLKTKIYVKLAELMIIHNHSQANVKVPIMLENIGNHYLKNIMTKYQAKEYFGRAIIARIYFNNDINEAKEYMYKFKKKDKTFEESQICILCSDIITCLEKGDNYNLNSSIQKLEEIYNKNDYVTIILDKIIDREKQKKKVNEEEKQENKEVEEEEEKGNEENEIVEDNNINKEEKKDDIDNIKQELQN